MPKIYILLPVHSRKEITRGFIECLVAQTFSDYHLVLIDDGSTDCTAEMVQVRIPSVTVLRGAGDWWWAGSLQQGINWLASQAISDDDIVLMINDDVAIRENFLQIGFDLIGLSTNALIQAQIYCDKTGEMLDAGMVFDISKLQFRQAMSNDEINCLTTNGLFVRWRDLKTIGNFYPRLLPHYLSDYEFTIRAYRKGMILNVPQELNLYWNKETTGFHNFEKLHFFSFLKSLFSKKSASNPIYWTVFAFMSSPIKYVPFHILRICKRTTKQIINHGMRRVKTISSKLG